MGVEGFLGLNDRAKQPSRNAIERRPSTDTIASRVSAIYNSRLSAKNSSSGPLPVWLRGDEMDTAQLRPQPEPRCINKNCPIKTPHGQGYLHNQGPLPVGRAVNEIAYPPEVIAELDKMMENPEAESPMFDAFNQEHVDPILKNGHLSHIKREQCLSKTCGVDVPHGQGMYFHDRRKNWRRSDTFEFCNPPPEIWDANDRIEGGSGTEEELNGDRDLVESFVAHHGDKVSRRDPSEYMLGFNDDMVDE